MIHIAYSYVRINKNVERKSVNNAQPINFSICFGCSKEPSHGDGSFEYPQHMFWWRNRKLKFNYALFSSSLYDDSFPVILRKELQTLWRGEYSGWPAILIGTF